MNLPKEFLQSALETRLIVHKLFSITEECGSKVDESSQPKEAYMLQKRAVCVGNIGHAACVHCRLKNYAAIVANLTREVGEKVGQSC